MQTCRHARIQLYCTVLSSQLEAGTWGARDRTHGLEIRKHAVLQEFRCAVLRCLLSVPGPLQSECSGGPRQQEGMSRDSEAGPEGSVPDVNLTEAGAEGRLTDVFAGVLLSKGYQVLPPGGRSLPYTAHQIRALSSEGGRRYIQEMA